MAVNEDGEVAGSVSGGCVEGRWSRGPGRPRRHRRAGSHVRLQRRRRLRRRPHLRRHRPPVRRAAGLVARGDVDLRAPAAASGPRAGGPGHRRRRTHVGAKLLVDRAGRPPAPRRPRARPRGRPRRLAELEAARSGVRHYGPQGETSPRTRRHAGRAGVRRVLRPAAADVDLRGGRLHRRAGAVAKVLGYQVTVCDAREVFATRRRFPMADEVVVSWPRRLFDERGSPPRRPRRHVHPHPRPQVRRAGHRRRPRHRRRLHRCDGQPHDHDKRLERLAEAGSPRPSSSTG